MAANHFEGTWEVDYVDEPIPGRDEWYPNDTDIVLAGEKDDAVYMSQIDTAGNAKGNKYRVLVEGTEPHETILLLIKWNVGGGPHLMDICTLDVSKADYDYMIHRIFWSDIYIDQITPDISTEQIRGMLDERIQLELAENASSGSKWQCKKEKS